MENQTSPKKFKIYPEPINLEVLKPSLIREEIINLIQAINDMYFDRYNDYLWSIDGLNQISEIFTGSSKFLFDLKFSEDVLLRYLKQINDIDVMVDRDKLKNLYDMLDTIVGENVGGHCWVYADKSDNVFRSPQITTEFDLMVQTIDEIAEIHPIKIDFIGVNFDCDKPTRFSKFAYSANWNDIVKGFRGFHHKCLLTNIVRAISENDNACILTPKSPIDGKLKIKKLYETPKMLAFSSDKGLREKYVKIESITYEGKDCYKEIATEDSNYITCPKDIFLSIFKKQEYDYDKFNSFWGLFDYMIKELDIDKVKKHVLNDLFGKNAIKFSKNIDEDKRIKFQIFYCFNEYDPETIESYNIIETYYKEFFMKG